MAFGFYCSCSASEGGLHETENNTLTASESKTNIELVIAGVISTNAHSSCTYQQRVQNID